MMLITHLQQINLFNMKLFAGIVLLFCCFLEANTQFTTIVNSTKTYASVPPTWLTSPYFRAGHQAVIQTLTGNNQTPTFTFTFSSALTGSPDLAYGIKNYRGNDYLGQQFYEIKKIGLSPATFSVAIQIYGVTNLWLLTIAYLAVEPTFPHHFNTFDNVPLNYSSGLLVNISARAPSTTYFTEYINYTQQASGRTYNTFSYPLSSNVVVLFMTSLWIQGTFGLPLQFHIDWTILNTNFYLLNATLWTEVMITNVHFSQVIFNKVDIQNSNKYQVIYYEWDNDMYGGWRSLPEAFMDNFIMGVTHFTMVDAHCGFEYQWEFANSSGVFGVDVLESWTLTNTCGFATSRTSVLFIQTWQCDPPYIYFNVSTELCQNMCGGYYVEDPVLTQCLTCTNPLCYQCDSSDGNICTECAAYDHFQLVNGTCECLDGYFYLEGHCVTCWSSNAGCENCTYGIISPVLPFNVSEFYCYDCNNTQNYFLVNGSCVACSIPHCITCSSLTTCTLCTTGYSVDVIFQCSTCAVLGCFTCSPGNNYLCDVCFNAGGYFLVPATQLCTSICGDGLTASGLEGCDDGNTASGDGCSSSCTLQPFFSCTILANLTTVCHTVCGDGVQNGLEPCDDGNLINGDSCSSLCKLEVVVSLQRLERDLKYCNSLQFSFKIAPYYSVLDQISFPNLIEMNSAALVHPAYTFDHTTLSLSYDFTEDMDLKILTLIENATEMLGYPNHTFIFTPSFVEVRPNNNVPANFLDEGMCAEKQAFEKGYKVLEIASYATLFLTMIPGKIIGLQLFGVLQLAYFSVGSIDSVNVLLSPLMKMKQLNGFSVPILGSSSQLLPQRVKEIKFYPSFLDNFNAMFLLMFVEILVGIVLYMISKITESCSKKLYSIANRLLKQFFLTLVLFNCFNISYASAIYFKFNAGNLTMSSFVTSIMSMAAMLVMTVMVSYANPEGFGEFKEKFKGDIVQTNYMSISILYRSLVGFLLAFSNDDDLSTLFTLGIALLFLMYNLINLPFSKAYHNYRACLCHFTQFATLFVAMYYRSMKSTSSPIQVAVIFSPAKTEFVLLFLCLFASILVLAYDSYLLIKGLSCFSGNSSTPDDSAVQVSHEQIAPSQIMGTQNDISQGHSVNQYQQYQ